MESEPENFGGPSKIMWGKTTLETVYEDDRTLTAKIPEEYLAEPAKVAVRVMNGYGRASNTVYFTIKKKAEDSAPADT